MSPFAGARYQHVPYSARNPDQLQFDAEIPAGRPPFPAVIIVHGGGWVAGDRIRNVEPLFEPFKQAGYAWFSISYTLAKDMLGIGSASDDIREAVHFIVGHAAEYRIDPNRIFLVGESAGAQLATLAVLNDPALPIRAVVSFYMPSDLEQLAQSSNHLRAFGVLNRPLAAMVMPRLRELSPLGRVRSGMPPLLLIHGTDDTVVAFEQSVAMCRTVRRAGNDCDLISVRGGSHGIRRWESAGLTGYRRLMLNWLGKR